MDKYIKLRTHGMSCAVCGEDIGPEDDVQICPDCGAVICRKCVETGAWDEHECEEEEEYED